MGTSASSPGPGGKVPLVPPWVLAIDATPSPQPPVNPENPPADTPPPSEMPRLDINLNIAPARRFVGARRGLGKFISSGSESDLRHGLGHYVRHGLGGSAMGTRRMAATARTANSLFNALSVLSSGQADKIALIIDPSKLAGQSFRQVMDSVVESIRPHDGTQDAEANRHAIADATSDLLEQFPLADIAALTPAQIELLIESYVAYDLCRRIDLDIGKHLLAKATSSAMAQQRQEEMNNFIIAQVRSLFAAKRSRGEKLLKNQITLLISGVIKEVMHIFEEYI